MKMFLVIAVLVVITSFAFGDGSASVGFFAIDGGYCAPYILVEEGRWSLYAEDEDNFTEYDLTYAVNSRTQLTVRVEDVPGGEDIRPGLIYNDPSSGIGARLLVGTDSADNMLDIFLPPIVISNWLSLTSEIRFREGSQPDYHIGPALSFGKISFTFRVNLNRSQPDWQMFGGVEVATW